MIYKVNILVYARVSIFLFAHVFCLSLSLYLSLSLSLPSYSSVPPFFLYVTLSVQIFFSEGLTVVAAEWLPRLAAKHCVFSKPLETPAPHYDPKVG